MDRYKIIRYLPFPYLFELFFLSAILAIIGLRLFLQITGFPQVGMGHLHIAHMLWGGLCMVLSIMGLMTFLNDDFKPFWAVLGGFGFGTFIDEVGKFISRDNDYFYQPTFAVIYVIFICLYLLYKGIQRNQLFTKDEYLINSLEHLKEVIITDLDREEKELALQYLRRSNPRHPVTKFLKQVFAELEDVPAERQGIYTKTRRTISSWYHFFIRQPWFLKAIDIFFVVRSLSYLLTGIFLIAAVGQSLLSGSIMTLFSAKGTLQLIQLGGLVLQAVLSIIGASIIWRSRRDAYRMFKDSVFVSLFILQVFHFSEDPVLALASVVGDLLLLNILNYMIAKEEEEQLSSEEE